MAKRGRKERLTDEIAGFLDEVWEDKAHAKRPARRARGKSSV